MSQSNASSLEEVLSGLGDVLSNEGQARLRILRLGKPVSLQASTRDQIYLMVQEAVLNAVRHWQSTFIKLEIEYRPKQLRLRVQDNGSGVDFKDIQSERSARLRLMGLWERADAIGAQLRVWSRERSGMLVEMSVPINRLNIQA